MMKHGITMIDGQALGNTRGRIAGLAYRDFVATSRICAVAQCLLAAIDKREWARTSACPAGYRRIARNLIRKARRIRAARDWRAEYLRPGL